MAWDELFADLAASAEAQEVRDRDAEIAERRRSAWGGLTWTARVRGARVALQVEGVGALTGDVSTVAGTWLLLRTDGSTDWVVALGAVLGVVGAPDSVPSASDGGEVASRTGWLGAWSVLARERTPVQLVRRDGSRVDGLAVRVGADFVDVRTDGGRLEAVPYGAISAVRCSRVG